MTQRVGRMSRALSVIACLALARGLSAQCTNTTTLGNTSTCFGTGSLANTTTSAINVVAFGYAALGNNTTGSANTGVGAWALGENSTGTYNTGIGHVSGANLTTGIQNTALGSWSLSASTTGDGNTALGFDTMGGCTTGSYNTAVGYDALGAIGTGGYNVAVGVNALASNLGGIDNTVVGYYALSGPTTGNANLALGIGAGIAYAGSESGNVLLANNGIAGESYVMRLGYAQTKTFVAGIHGVTSSSGIPVYVNASGQLGTATSSLRFKEDVADMGAASDELMRLRPVTFHYKAAYDDGQRILQYGLIAEEVAAIDPGLVQFDADGQALTVRYHFVDAMLLGEVQKQHANLAGQAALVARQAAEIASQKSAIASQKTEIAEIAGRLAKLEAVVAALHP